MAKPGLKAIRIEVRQPSFDVLAAAAGRDQTKLAEFLGLTLDQLAGGLAAYLQRLEAYLKTTDWITPEERRIARTKIYQSGWLLCAWLGDKAVPLPPPVKADGSDDLRTVAERLAGPRGCKAEGAA
jgi:hypothetical protein